MVDPWDDPNLMTLYHVQVETKDILVSYEIAAEVGEATQIALNHFREFIANPTVFAWVGGCSSIGYVPAVESPGKVLEWKVLT